MTELAEQQEQQVGTSKKPRRSHNGLWIGIIFFIVISLAGAGFYLYTLLSERQEGLGGEVKGVLNKQIGDYQNQLTAIQSQLAALEADIAGKDTHFTKTLADFSSLHNQKLENTRNDLNESITFIQRQLGKTRGDWLVADAEYLLSVANERLYLIGDVNTTREALEAADQRLRESGDAAAFKVREQIVKEIGLLRSVVIPDVVGMYASLDSLASEVDKLELILPYSGKALSPTAETSASETPKAAPTTEEGEPEGEGLLDTAEKALEGIVTIRHTDQAIDQILTPEQALFIREQLRVKLEMVKIALVQHNEPLYHASLEDTKHWIGLHFNSNDVSKNVVAELERLAAIKIRSQFPDISLSLKMLKDITKLRIETDKAIEPNKPAPAAAVTPPAAPAVQVIEKPTAAPLPTEKPAEAEPAAE